MGLIIFKDSYCKNFYIFHFNGTDHKWVLILVKTLLAKM